MRGSLAQLIAVHRRRARMTQNATFDGVSTDSRTAGAGALFVALRGENFDAHDFLDAGRGKRRRRRWWSNSCRKAGRCRRIVVPDTLVALGQIANFWRAQFGIPVIGVTGSNGKTTVKEMIAAILAQAHGEERPPGHARQPE